MIQRNLEERVYFVVKLSGNSPSLDRDLEAGPSGQVRTGTWRQGLVQRPQEYDLLAYSACFLIPPRATCLEVTLPPVARASINQQ